MTAARCPQCGSHNVTSDASNGGAGRNHCTVCNHRAPVVDFHKHKTMVFAANPEQMTRIASHFTFRRSILDDEPPSTPPAPIRQYRDD